MNVCTVCMYMQACIQCIASDNVIYIAIQTWSGICFLESNLFPGWGLALERLYRKYGLPQSLEQGDVLFIARVVYSAHL